MFWLRLWQNSDRLRSCLQVNSHVWLFKTFMEARRSASPQVCSSVLKLTVTSRNGSELIKEIRRQPKLGAWDLELKNSILGSFIINFFSWTWSLALFSNTKLARLLSWLRRKKMNEVLDSGGYEISKTMARDSYPKYIWWDGRHIRTDACI